MKVPAKPSEPKRSRRTARSAPGSLPRVPRTFDMQAESRRLLEEVLQPWLVTRWEQNDFGVDAAVEVTDPVSGTGDREATGRLFGVQLKATDSDDKPTSLVVTTGHLQYWLRHTLPILLVSAHLPSRTLRARWIDAALRVELRARTPALWSQDTVGIPLTLTLDARSLSLIEPVVRAFKPKERMLSPGRFFGLRERVLAMATELDAVAAASGVQSATLAVQGARARMRSSAYLVAIAGPQRVGKSTMVNALLGVSVSPVADYPTTAVPLLFDAGDVAVAEVTFADGRVVRVGATSEAIRPFAAQQENDANAKAVRLVRVTLPNDVLANGIALLDTPGLHDASEAVREVTARALHDADAVLYVLDASLGAKFKLGRAEIEDLQALHRAKDRLIVVLNQADGLDVAQRVPLLAYVESQLRRYGIWEHLPVEPVFVSAQAAWTARSHNDLAPAEFAALEDQIWGHLLRTRATGMHRLVQAVDELREGADIVAGMLSSRAREGADAGQIDAVRRVCANTRGQVLSMMREWRDGHDGGLQAFLVRRKALWLEQLEVELQESQTLESLPKSAVLATRLRDEVGQDGNDAVTWLRSEADTIATAVGLEVRRALRDSRGHLGIPADTALVIPLPRLLPPVDMSLPEAGFGAFSGLVGFLINPAVGIATTLLGWIMGHDYAVKERRRKAVVAIRRVYAQAQSEPYQHLGRQASERVRAITDAVVTQATGRLDTFINDADQRMQRLGRPLSTHEITALASLVERSKGVRGDLVAVQREVLGLVAVDEQGAVT